MYALTNSTIYTGSNIEQNKAILIDENNIIGIINEKDLPIDIKCYDLNGCNVTPGFIDLQVYGGGDVLFAANPTVEALYKISENLQRSGTTRYLIAIPSSSPETISKCIQAVKSYLNEGGPSLIGLHLEGPFINVERKGAHSEKHIKPLTIAELKKLVAESDDVIKMITLAPEQCNQEIIEFLNEQGIVISAGHSNATYNEAKAAFEMGIKTCTHLFNAMSAFAHREPGMVGAIYDSDHVFSSIIPDGYHSDFASLRISKKVMKERLFIISDAVVEHTEGEYIYHKSNGKFVNGKGTLAGSSLTMFKGVRNCIEKADIDVAESLRMASTYPAKVIGLDHHLGKIAPEFAADLVVFDDDYQIHNIITDGKLIALD